VNCDDKFYRRGLVRAIILEDPEDPEEDTLLQLDHFAKPKSRSFRCDGFAYQVDGATPVDQDHRGQITTPKSRSFRSDGLSKADLVCPSYLDQVYGRGQDGSAPVFDQWSGTMRKTKTRLNKTSLQNSFKRTQDLGASVDKTTSRMHKDASLKLSFELDFDPADLQASQDGSLTIPPAEKPRNSGSLTKDSINFLR